MTISLAALQGAGPWLITAFITISLLSAVVKVMIWDHALVPFALLQDERARTDKALGVASDTLTALQRQTDAIRDLKELVEQARREMRDWRASVEEDERRRQRERRP